MTRAASHSDRRTRHFARRYGSVACARSRRSRRRERRVPHAARSVGLGQDHAADGARRLHPARRGQRPLRRPRGRSASRRTSATSGWCSRTTRCSRTSTSPPTSRFPLQAAQGRREPNPRGASRRRSRWCKLGGLGKRRVARALRRPAAARGARARHRVRAAHRAHGRAAVRARQAAARPHADRAAAAARQARHDHDLRHARPARGAHDVRPHRGDRQRPRAAGRHAARPLRAPANRFVAEFIGESTLLEVEVRDGALPLRRRARSRWRRGPAAPPRRGTCCCGPSGCTSATARPARRPQRPQGTVTDVIYQGDTFLVQATLANGARISARGIAHAGSARAHARRAATRASFGFSARDAVLLTPRDGPRAPADAPTSHAAGLRRDALVERLSLLGLAAPAAAAGHLHDGAAGGLALLALLPDRRAAASRSRTTSACIEQPSYARIFGATFKVSFITTGICVLLGYPLAYVLSQLPRAGRSVLPRRGDAAVLDLDPGAHLCVARAAAAAGARSTSGAWSSACGTSRSRSCTTSPAR